MEPVEAARQGIRRRGPGVMIPVRHVAELGQGLPFIKSAVAVRDLGVFPQYVAAVVGRELQSIALQPAASEGRLLDAQALARLAARGRSEEGRHGRAAVVPNAAGQQLKAPAHILAILGHAHRRVSFLLPRLLHHSGSRDCAQVGLDLARSVSRSSRVCSMSLNDGRAALSACSALLALPAVGPDGVVEVFVERESR
ncbi:hypothetical protein Mapa_015517 [Marchantia paleacea]|nr:hypothetical protein Mapa_015517 [Marchantia paleacea]